MKFNSSRSGVGDRPYEYQVCTPELLDNLIAEAMDNLELARGKYFEKTEGELDKIIEGKANRSRQQFFRKYGRAPEEFESELFSEVIDFDGLHSLDVLTAEEQRRVDKLVALRSEVVIRASLLESALGRYAAASIVSIGGDDIGSIDVERFGGVEGDRLPPDLSMG